MDQNQKTELKVMALREALRERVAAITDEYENKIIDLRVEITELYMDRQRLQEQVDAFLADKEEGDAIGSFDDAVPEQDSDPDAPGYVG